MIQAMYSGVSGLKAFKSQLDVIGNNIANLNTIGFKGSRVSFQDMMSQTWSSGTGPYGGSGGVNPIQVGLGVTVGAVDADTSEGSLQSTGKSSDVAIQGGGYLMLGDGSSTMFSRDGTLTLDADYNLVSASSGRKVLGWTPDATGKIDVTATPNSAAGIKIPIGNMSTARQTSVVEMGKNLNANAPNGTTVTPNAKVYDSLGIEHTLNIAFTKSTTTPNRWDYTITSPDVTGNVGTGSVDFDSKGFCTTADANISMTLSTANGSKSPFAFKMDFSGMTQLADTTGGSSVASFYQDGLTVGTLESFEIGKDGMVTGVFGNGNTQVLGQIALAVFSNPAGLVRAGGNLVSQGQNSGIAQVAPPASAGAGSLTSGFVESSNVDLSNEFANMIIAQRGFQANARTITTSDEVIQELVQLKR